MDVRLTCRAGDRQGQKWTLRLEPDRVVVLDGAMFEVTSFPAAEFRRRFKSQAGDGRETFSLLLADRWQAFDVDALDRRTVEAFREEQRRRARPSLAEAARSAALLEVVFGAVAIVSSCSGAVLPLLFPPRHYYNLAYLAVCGLLLFGLVLFSKGVFGLTRASIASAAAGSLDLDDGDGEDDTPPE